jgi:hypothetical protein
MSTFLDLPELSACRATMESTHTIPRKPHNLRTAFLEEANRHEGLENIDVAVPLGTFPSVQ